jgi:hypothetical protein
VTVSDDDRLPTLPPNTDRFCYKVSQKCTNFSALVASNVVRRRTRGLVARRISEITGATVRHGVRAHHQMGLQRKGKRSASFCSGSARGWSCERSFKNVAFQHQPASQRPSTSLRRLDGTQRRSSGLVTLASPVDDADIAVALTDGPPGEHCGAGVAMNCLRTSGSPHRFRNTKLGIG